MYFPSLTALSHFSHHASFSHRETWFAEERERVGEVRRREGGGGEREGGGGEKERGWRRRYREGVCGVCVMCVACVCVCVPVVGRTFTRLSYSCSVTVSLGETLEDSGKCSRHKYYVVCLCVFDVHFYKPCLGLSEA